VKTFLRRRALVSVIVRFFIRARAASSESLLRISITRCFRSSHSMLFSIYMGNFYFDYEYMMMLELMS
jgi:hypothetical protein